MAGQLDRALYKHSRGRYFTRAATYVAFEGRPLTTRGQSINWLVRANIDFGSRLFSAAVTSPIFIVGLGRSGTTLTGSLFGAHPDLGFVNEGKLIWNWAVPDEDVIGSYSVRPGRLRLSADDVTSESASRLRAAYGYYLRLTRSARLVEKYPELIYRTGFVSAVFPDAKFIAVVRRPDEAAASIASWDRRRESDVSDVGWWGLGDRKWWTLWREVFQASSNFGEIADRWDPETPDQAVRGVLEWLGVAHEVLGNKQLVRVSYEDLVANPANELSRLCREVGIDPRPEMLNYAQAVVGDQRAHKSSDLLRFADRLPSYIGEPVLNAATALGYGA